MTRLKISPLQAPLKFCWSDNDAFCLTNHHYCKSRTVGVQDLNGAAHFALVTGHFLAVFYPDPSADGF
jgi:hypothetical protein